MNRKSQVKKGELCPACGRYYDRHVVCDGLIIDDGKVLLMLRNQGDHKDRWACPGGYLDWSETIEQCIVREVEEELGVKSKIKKLFGVYSDPMRDPHNLQNVAVVFLLTLQSRKFSPKQQEVADLCWFPLDKLPSKIAFDHRKIIEEYIEKIRIPKSEIRNNIKRYKYK